LFSSFSCTGAITMLTRKQKELLVLIRDRVAADGVPPSFDEMKDALGLRSKSGIHRLITGLEERGFIKRLPHRARALEITRMPEGMDVKSSKSSSRKRTPVNDLPDMAAIAAGTPIEALRDLDNRIEVPAVLINGGKGRPNPDDHYVLEISGDSMIEAGIMDGDRVVIRKCDDAESGAIVVALIEGHEATLKYLEKRSGQVALIHGNKSYETRLFPPDHVEVQGRLVGLVRSY
jgi:repressor LexA